MIRAEIESRGGSISFERYMERVLSHPELGYYGSRRDQFGPRGDFVTAPEISPLFAQALARQCVEVLSRTGGDTLLEVGAGSGRLVLDLLDALEPLRNEPVRYIILEPSESLRGLQHDTIAKHAPERLSRISWLADWPRGLTGVVIANEVLDALPVRCFEVAESGILERRVSLSAEQAFTWHREPPGEPLLTAFRNIARDLQEPLPTGYISEINLRLGPWMHALSASLSRGVALLVDYGYPRREYFHPQRHTGTLLCHYRHRAHADPFFLPGLQDLSANVDFTAVAEAGLDAGMRLLGYASQAHFILASGLDGFLDNVGGTGERLRRAQELKRLTLPSEMGERFQIMALGKDYDRVPSRFALRDLTHRL